jgi:hypothetical protein
VNTITWRWPLFTSLGLAAGIGAGLLLQRPIEAIVGMILVTPAVTVLVGLLLGVGQWFEVRRHLRASHRWLLATALGLGAGLAVGVVAVELVGQLVLGSPLRLMSLSPVPQSLNMLVVGAIAGAMLGAAQRLWVRDLPPRWPLFSALGLGLGLALGSVVANALAGAISTPAGFALLVAFAGMILGISTRSITRLSVA